jgi:hypothetical protein
MSCSALVLRIDERIRVEIDAVRFSHIADSGHAQPDETPPIGFRQPGRQFD